MSLNARNSKFWRTDDLQLIEGCSFKMLELKVFSSSHPWFYGSHDKGPQKRVLIVVHISLYPKSLIRDVRKLWIWPVVGISLMVISGVDGSLEAHMLTAKKTEIHINT